MQRATCFAKYTLVCCLFLLAFTMPVQAQRIYVNATSGNDASAGTSWATAVQNLQVGITKAVSAGATSIWVAKGTYYPTSGTDRTASFAMRNNLAIYGGFAGNEAPDYDLAQRNFVTNQTILSGDIDKDGILNAGNSYHVINNDRNGVNETAILDGFTMMSGFANGNDYDRFGGGVLNVLTSPTLSNLRILNCFASSGGGAMYSYLSSPISSNTSFEANYAEEGGAVVNLSSPGVTTFINCTFTNNKALNNGGALLNADSDVAIYNCIFNNDTATRGGAIYNLSSSPMIENSTFSGNTASSFGGAIFSSFSRPKIINSIFQGNTALQQGGALHNDNLSEPEVSNCLISGNSAGNLGGALMSSSSPGGTFTNCTITGNSAGQQGGAMYCFQSTGMLLKNCIIWNNRAAGQINTATATTQLDIGNARFDHCLVANSGGSSAWNGAIGVDLGNNIAMDPLFITNVDLSNLPNSSGNVQLVACSPAINAGNNTDNTTTEDLAGNPRKIGVIDLGAYEYQGATGGAIVYVHATATGSNNGSSWANAYTDLQDALANTCPGTTQIWVAKGTYYPTDGSDRFAAFAMRNNLTIYGGFAGNEAPDYNLAQRNFTTNQTNLSGDIDKDGVLNAGNSYHVINNKDNGVNNTAILDGFTVMSGFSDGTGNERLGGGILNVLTSPTLINLRFVNCFAIMGGAMFNSSASPIINNTVFDGNNATEGGAVNNSFSLAVPTFINCTFTNNTASIGGGIYSYLTNSIISNCTFKGNSSTRFGGAIFSRNSKPGIINCIFQGNTALEQGGAMHSDFGSEPVVTNTLFSGNSAGNFGGAIMTSSSPGGTFTNCTITGNSAGQQGGAMYFFQSTSPLFKNCIIWNNRAAGQTNTATATSQLDNGTANFNYCLVANSGGSSTWNAAIGVDQGNNTAMDPLFISNVDLTTLPNSSGNAQLQSCSPAINAGNSADNTTTEDLAGNPRKVSVIDLGAYEYQGGATGAILYVHASATGNNNGKSWANAFTDLQDALANACPDITQIWVAKGTYYPTAGTNRTTSFAMRNNLAIYGGFAGNEAPDYDLALRNFVSNQTNLSGDIDKDGILNEGNSYHVINNNDNGVNNTAILDGFTVMSGFANGSLFERFGGGIINRNTSPTLTNLIFVNCSAMMGGGAMYNNAAAPFISNTAFEANNANNEGGAVYNTSILINPTFSNCTFENNTATIGGAMYNTVNNTIIFNCIFKGNSSTRFGGAIFSRNSKPSIINCIFQGNTALEQGGAMHSDFFSEPVVSNTLFSGNTAGDFGGAIMTSSSPGGTFTNCTITGNSAGQKGGAIYCFQTTDIVFKNCIIWNNRAAGQTNTATATSQLDNGAANFNYCLVANSGGSSAWNAAIGADQGNNTAMDPLFISNVDLSTLPNSSGNIQLQACSPAINAGNNADNTTTEDLAGNPRKISAIDMGAYEYQATTASLVLAGAHTTISRVLAAGEYATLQTNCSLLAVLQSQGTSPVAGNLTAKVWIQPSTPANNNIAYVRRHYEIVPDNNAATATGRITLYFTQADFDDYNSTTDGPDLPLNAADAANNKANFAIIKYPGASANGTGLPNTYTGSGVPVSVKDGEVTLVWDNALQAWAASFDTEGFSGFFAGNETIAILPLEDLLTFAGRQQGETNSLQWQVSPNHRFLNFDLQKSTNGTQFSSLATQAPTAGITNYQQLDHKPAQHTWYRLKLTEHNGAIMFSKVVLLRKITENIQLMVAPNPATRQATLQITVVADSRAELTVLNTQGSRITGRNLQLTKGANTITLDVSGWPGGMYLIQVAASDGTYKTAKILKP